MLLSDPFYGDTAAGKPDIMAWITGFPYEKVGKDVEACVKYLQARSWASFTICGAFCGFLSPCKRSFWSCRWLGS